MSDRTNVIIVVLEEDTRIDDAEETLLPAIRQLRGVLSAEAKVSDPSAEWMAAQRVKADLRKRLLEVLT